MKNLPAYSRFNLVASAVFSTLVLSLALAFKAFGDKPACAIALTKMNVVYVGLDNPLTIVVRGVPLERLTVGARSASLQKVEGDRYLIRADTVGVATITVSGGDLEATTFKFRVKRIPDPTLLLGSKYRSRSMPNGEYKSVSGLAAVLENFDFDAKCEIVRYVVTYLPKRRDPVSTMNVGARFNERTEDWIRKAKPGDAYFFDDVEVRCPGDAWDRKLEGLAFRIR